MQQSHTGQSSGGETPVLTIVEKVAEREGVDPADLGPPLHDAIDTDALNRVFTPTEGAVRDTGRLSFEYYGYKVTVRADGDVSVRDEPDRRNRDEDAVRSR